MSVETRTAIPHVVRGTTIDGAEVAYDGFATPAIDVDDLVWPRDEPPPAHGVAVAEIIDVLTAVGERLRDDPDGDLAAALQALGRLSPYESRILEASYANLWHVFDPTVLRAVLDGELGGAEAIDSWVPRRGPDGRAGAVRAFPARIVHVLAGNSPGVAAITIARGALSKGAHLIKLPSNDLLTATAILRSLAAVAPEHPVTRSFSAAYWRGGDERIEGVLFRPQFFDKLVVWGGEAAVRNVAQYVGPGLELISFDPKNSISMIGREVFASDGELAEVANLAALDATLFNQEACVASRVHFVEGSTTEVDGYCELLQRELGRERPLASAVVDPLPLDARFEIDALRELAPYYRVIGQHDGRGIVVRSEEPIDLVAAGKTVNVVRVDSLDAAVRYVNLATQTVGLHPPPRRLELRDRLAAMGVQRVVPLGHSLRVIPGFAHDGFYPLHRFVRWVNDEHELPAEADA